MSSITVEPFRPEQAAEASRVLARAFASNPAHVAAFGSPAPFKNEAFFRTVLTVTKGPKFVATDGSRIFGLIHWVHSSECQVSPGEKLRLLPVMTAKLGIAATLRVLSWLSMWSKHDPKASHLHLGPIGVAPEAQGYGMTYPACTGVTGYRGVDPCSTVSCSIAMSTTSPWSGTIRSTRHSSSLIASSKAPANGATLAFGV